MKIVIDGLPIAQARMKYSGRNGIGRMYDPREKQKRQLKEEIKRIFGEHGSFINPRVSFVFHMAIPAYIKKKDLALYTSGLLKHQKKPDVDNFVKLYLDCIDGIVFEGDQKVILGPCVKIYHPHPKTIIIVNEMQETLSPQEIDPLTWLALFGPECGRCSYAEMVCLPDSYTPSHPIFSQSADMNYLQHANETLLAKPLAPEAMALAYQALKYTPQNAGF